MTFVIKSRMGDGKISSVIVDEFNQIKERAEQLRSAGQETWVENVDGQRIDEKTGAVAP